MTTPAARPAMTMREGPRERRLAAVRALEAALVDGGHYLSIEGTLAAVDAILAAIEPVAEEVAEEAHPSEERFRVEIHDGGQWMPAGSPTQHRQVALDALAARRAAAKTWAADGEPVRWRVVRETTTYTVEADR